MKKFIGTAKALCRYNRENTIIEIGEEAQCTQYEIDCGYFDGATLKAEKKIDSSPSNKSLSSKSTKGRKAKKDE